VTAAVLVVLFARRDEFAAAVSAAAASVLAVTVLLQIMALVAGGEAWHLTIEGGRRDRRSPRAQFPPRLAARPRYRPPWTGWMPKCGLLCAPFRCSGLTLLVHRINVALSR
jgi:hypothetical protein